MTPAVFICNSIAELVQRAGVGEYISLSNDLAMEIASTKILKAAAPLCLTNWRIYVERSANGESCRFGVFYGSSDPSTLTIDEVVLDGYEDGFPVVRISQTATNKVEVRTNAGDGIEFRFNDDVDVPELNRQEHLVGLANSISAKVADSSGNFSGFLDRVLSTAVGNSHGTLIAVVPSGGAPISEALGDRLEIAPSIQLYERFQRHLDEDRTAISVSRLQAASELVSGFICSDGITIFNDAGEVLAYRAFVKSDGGAKPSTGGARSRAFAVLKQLVGTDLIAAFFRSQDGKTEFVSAPKGDAP